MDSFWDGERPKAIPMVPEVLNTRNSLHGQKQEKLLKQAN